MKTKLYVLSLLCLLAFSGRAAAQQPLDDAGKLAIGVFHPTSEMTGVSDQACGLLYNNLMQAVSLNGISAIDGRFMILPRIAVTDQQVTGTAPAKFITSLEVSFFLVDLMTRTVMGQASISAKGIGNSSDQSTMAAVRNISSRNPRLKTFIVKGKEKVISYFDAYADQIILRTRSHIARGDYASAMAEIRSVPSACTDLYNRMSELLSGIPAEKQTDPRYLTESSQQWVNSL